jgi:two-component system NtrC family response regulator
LICGETGTGKELVARALHDQSLRAEMPFVPINCGALPENLIESELFGHRKGAFTGAEEHRIGLFQVANGGTLFLDEIGELPKSMQAKLLRFLESGEIRRVGDNESLICDVRVICATNRHLDQMVAAGDFREDLWFRINTFEITLPPLRERIDDILPLARHLVTRKGMRLGSEDELFTPETAAALRQHTWPGNVRELANVVEHAMILCEQAPIGPEHLPRRFSARPTAPATPAAAAPAVSPQSAAPATAASAAKPATPNLRQREMQAILDALNRHGGNKPKAAEELGISLKTLYNKLNQAASLEKTA